MSKTVNVWKSPLCLSFAHRKSQKLVQARLSIYFCRVACRIPFKMCAKVSAHAQWLGSDIGGSFLSPIAIIHVQTEKTYLLKKNREISWNRMAGESAIEEGICKNQAQHLFPSVDGTMTTN